MAGDGDRGAHDGDDGLFEVGGGHRGAKEGERVDAARGRVDQAGVVVLPAGLVLLRAAVVVHGEQDRSVLGGPGAQVDCGLAAVGADFEERVSGARSAGPASGLVEGQALGLGHEPDGLAGDGPQVLVHRFLRRSVRRRVITNGLC